MTKEELAKYIRVEREVVWDAVWLSHLASVVVQNPQVCAQIVPTSFEVGLDGLFHTFQMPSGADFVRHYPMPRWCSASMRVIKTAMRNALTQPYESTQAYCEKNNLQRDFQNADWRPFARIVRNSFSHDFRLDFKRRDGKKKGQLYDDVSLQFSDRQITLSNSLHGTLIDGAILPIKYMLELIDKMLTFAEDLP